MWTGIHPATGNLAMGKGALHVFYIKEAVGLEVGFGGSKRNAFAFPGLPCVEGFA